MGVSEGGSPLDRVWPVAAGRRPGGPVIGVDLGTSSCRVGYCGKDGPRLITSRRQEAIPALVAVDPSGGVVVGEAAAKVLAADATRVASAPKLLLGDGLAMGVQAYRGLSTCELLPTAEGEVGARLGGRVFPAVELVALLLCEAREWAQEALGEPVARLVVSSVPGRGPGYERRLLEACRRAGFYVESALTEPTAAVLASIAAAGGRPDGQTRRVAVCDAGASGFRVSLMAVTDGACRILASQAEPSVSGLELDRRLLRRVVEASPGVREGGQALLTRLMGATERAKVSLSRSSTTRLHVPFAYVEGDQPRDVDLTLTRELLEGEAGLYVERAIRLCEEVSVEAGVDPGGVDELLLVGGAIQLPLMQRRLREWFAGVPVVILEPESAVALGTAWLAGRLGPTS